MALDTPGPIVCLRGIDKTYSRHTSVQEVIDDIQDRESLAAASLQLAVIQ